MRSDLILRTVIGFLIPILFLYSCCLLFSLDNVSFISVLNSSIYLMLSYILFYLRFNEIGIKKVISLKLVTNIILMVFFIFLIFLLFNLVS